MKYIVFMSLTDNTEQSYLLTDITCLNLLTTYRKREYSQKLIDNIESIRRRIYGKSN